MTHDRQDDTNIERQQELQHNEEAFRLRQEEKRLRAARLNTPFVWIINTIFWLVRSTRNLTWNQILAAVVWCQYPK